MTPCYNEEANVFSVYNQVREVMARIGKYEYEHIFIDNSSTDNTVAILKAIAAEDPSFPRQPQNCSRVGMSRIDAMPRPVQPQHPAPRRSAPHIVSTTRGTGRNGAAATAPRCGMSVQPKPA